MGALLTLMSLWALVLYALRLSFYAKRKIRFFYAAAPTIGAYAAHGWVIEQKIHEWEIALGSKPYLEWMGLLLIVEACWVLIGLTCVILKKHGLAYSKKYMTFHYMPMLTPLLAILYAQAHAFYSFPATFSFQSIALGVSATTALALIAIPMGFKRLIKHRHTRIELTLILGLAQLIIGTLWTNPYQTSSSTMPLIINTKDTLINALLLFTTMIICGLIGFLFAKYIPIKKRFAHTDYGMDH